MGLYAFFLAGSNYFAPVICGFIAEYHGWRWVFYWPAIFCGAAMVVLSFLMEETNYARQRPSIAGRAVEVSASENDNQKDNEKGPMRSTPSSQSRSDPEVGAMYTKKAYMQKLSILGPCQARNNMLRRTWQTVYYLSWPVIFYAGCVFSANTERG